MAEACDISEAALYKYFDSKAEIYDAVLDCLTERLDCEQMFEQLSKSDDLELILNSIADFLIGFLTENVDLYRLLLFSALSGHEKAKKISGEIRGKFIVFLSELLRRLENQGVIVDINPFITARCFIGMIMDCAMGINFTEAMGIKKIMPEHAMANNVPIYVRGLLKKQNNS